MKPHTKLEPGDLVQLDPENVINLMLSGCIMVVTEPRPFGAMGYVVVPGQNGQPGGHAYYRPNWHEMELVGRAMWVVAS